MLRPRIVIAMSVTVVLLLCAAVVGVKWWQHSQPTKLALTVSAATDATKENPAVRVSLDIPTGRSSCTWYGSTTAGYVGSTDANGLSEPPLQHEITFPCPTESEPSYFLQADCRDVEGQRFVSGRVTFTLSDSRCYAR